MLGRREAGHDGNLPIHVLEPLLGYCEGWGGSSGAGAGTISCPAAARAAEFTARDGARTLT